MELLWKMSIQASVLILVVMLVRFLIKKLPKGYSYLLWILVLLRLLCPVFIESSVSMQPVIGQKVSGPVTGIEAQGTVTGQTQDTPVFAGVETLTDHRQMQENVSVADSEQAQENMPISDSAQVQNKVPVTDNVQAQEKVPVADGTQKAGIEDITKVAWILGVIAVAGVFLWQYIEMKQRVKTAVKESGNIWLCDRIDSPFVMGVFMPRIFLPFGMEEGEKEYVLCHERIHIRHRDPMVRFLCCIALCLHWWNPLVWLSAFLMNRDMEMFCDETALRDADLEERKAYSEALLRFAVQRSRLSLALGFGESNTEKRVHNILNLKKPKLILSIAVMAVILVCAICFLTVPKTDDGAEQTETEETEKTATTENGENSLDVIDREYEITDYVLSATEFEKGVNWVRATGDYGEDTEYFAFVRDFDKDGKEEAFIAIGSLVNAIPTKDSEKMIFGDLWYASGTGEPQLLRSEIKVYGSQQIISLEDEYILILYYGDGEWNTDMYQIQQNKAKRCFSDAQYAGVTLKYLDKGELMMTWNVTDEVFYEADDSFAGSNAKEYPYAVKGNFYEIVPAVEMSEKDFVNACGSDGIINKIRESYEADYMQFLRRDNGIWHVNIAEAGGNYKFSCITYTETGTGLTEVKAEKGYYRMDPCSLTQDFCELVRVTRKEEQLADDKDYFFNRGRRVGRSEESIQECYDLLQQLDVCEQDKYRIADYFIMFIDDNMEEDYLVMLRQNDWSYEYTAKDYEDKGRFLIFMNGEQVYSYSDLDYSFTCWYGFTMDFCTDFDNDGYEELFLEAYNGGTGGNDIMVLKCKDGAFEQMPIFTRGLDDRIPYIDISVYAGKGADEYEIYCANRKEAIVLTGGRLGADEIGRIYEPGEEIGYAGDYHSPDVVDYEGKNALLIKMMLKGEGGNVHYIGSACFVLTFDVNQNCEIADWWVEDPDGTVYR